MAGLELVLISYLLDKRAIGEDAGIYYLSLYSKSCSATLVEISSQSPCYLPACQMVPRPRVESGSPRSGIGCRTSDLGQSKSSHSIAPSIKQERARHLLSFSQKPCIIFRTFCYTVFPPKLSLNLHSPRQRGLSAPIM